MKYNLDNRADLMLYLGRFKSLPETFKAEILSWDIVKKSPYGPSFYSSKEKRWDFTPEGCLRVSNHWNFRSKRHPQQVHCVTDKAVPNNSHWTLAEFHEGIWRVKQSYPIYKSRKSARRKTVSD